MSVEDWENDGGTPPRMVHLELEHQDAQYLMNRANLNNTPQDRRILDAFRYAFLNGYDTPPR